MRLPLGRLLVLTTRFDWLIQMWKLAPRNHHQHITKHVRGHDLRYEFALRRSEERNLVLGVFEVIQCTVYLRAAERHLARMMSLILFLLCGIR